MIQPQTNFPLTELYKAKLVELPILQKFVKPKKIVAAIN